MFREPCFLRASLKVHSGARCCRYTQIQMHNVRQGLPFARGVEGPRQLPTHGEDATQVPRVWEGTRDPSLYNSSRAASTRRGQRERARQNLPAVRQSVPGENILIKIPV
ncbi:hypothetical protein evm_014375 [Chilo suppressalis]|nr:hypothetical protein evm_014375 [Chilo suppressalis]